MRYLDEVTFVKESPDSHYDPDLGEWVEKEPTRTVFSANITDIGTDRSAKVFGDIKKEDLNNPLFYRILKQTLKEIYNGLEQAL